MTVSCASHLRCTLDRGAEFRNYVDVISLAAGRRGRNGEQMTSAAIRRAQDEYATVRQRSERASTAILSAVGSKPVNADRLIERVAKETGLDRDTVLHAMWGLLGQRKITMSHDYKLTAKH